MSCAARISVSTSALSQPGTEMVSAATMVAPTLSSRSAKLISAATSAPCGSFLPRGGGAGVIRPQKPGEMAARDRHYGVGAGRTGADLPAVSGDAGAVGAGRRGAQGGGRAAAARFRHPDAAAETARGDGTDRQGQGDGRRAAGADQPDRGRAGTAPDRRE